jgi:hypothetical protein
MKPGETLSSFLGDHEGLAKYNDSYGTKNMNDIRHILAANTNSTSMWGLGLRNYVHNHDSARFSLKNKKTHKKIKNN